MSARPPSGSLATARVVTLLLIALLGARCGGADGGGAGQAPTGGKAPGTLPVLRHDFGAIPHGEAREHSFEIDVFGQLGADWRPLNTSVDCSCAKAQMAVRRADGQLRALQVARAEAMPVIAQGERLVVRVQLDTATKEPVDFGPADSNATLVLQSTAATPGDPSGRVFWPLRFRFAVDSPVTVRPFAVLDFERVAASVPRELTLALGGDLQDQVVRFGPARCDDPRIDLTLEPTADGAILRARFSPEATQPRLGGFRQLVVVDTDLPSGYQVKLAAVGTVIPDLEAMPMAKLSLTADLRQPQAPDDPRVRSQFVTVRDHDPRRGVEFRVVRIVDRAGRDASGHFEITLEPRPGDERSSRLQVRYLGGCTEEFRGEIVLGKDPDNGPFLPIELVALQSTSP